MRYQIEIKKSAEKELNSLSKNIYQSITEKILSLSENPRPSGYKKLKGGTNQYRIRSGDYRIIYTINDKLITVVVIKIGHRGDVYQ